MSDDELLRGSGREDHEAFSTLMERYHDRLLGYSRAWSRDAERSKDAVQEVFLAIWKGAATYRGPNARAWIYTIARNTLCRQFRYETRAPEERVPLDELGVAAGWGDPNARERIESAVLNRDELDTALHALDVYDRELLVRVDVYGLSLEEAAENDGVTVAALKSRHHRARLRLVAALRRGQLVTSALPSQRTVGGLSCAEVLALLSEYLGGLCDPVQRAAIESHVQGCDVCERFGGTFGRVVAGLRARLGAD